jgi:hypothetical protein
MVGVSALFLALAIGYNLRTPYRTGGLYVPSGIDMSADLSRYSQAEGPLITDIGAPDERAHVNYVRMLAGGKFPVFRVGDGEGYENHQPPLYYLLCVPIEKLSGESDGFVLRLLTSFMGLAAVWGVYFVGLRLARPYAVTIAAVAALFPSFLTLSSSVSNDPLLIVWCTFGLLLCIDGGVAGWSWRRALAIGVLCGLALLTKTSALVLVAFCALAPLLAARRSPHPNPPPQAGEGVLEGSAPSEPQPLAGEGVSRAAQAGVGEKGGSIAGAIMASAIILMVALIISAPWFARNASLYGDPLGMRIFQEGFTGSPRAEMFIGAYGGPAYLFQWVGWWTFRSLFGVFSYAQLLFPAWVYIVCGLVCLTALATNVRRNPIAEVRASALSWLLFALVFLGFLRFNMTYFQAQARYLLPAIAPISAGLTLGLVKLAPKKAAGLAGGLLVTFLILLNLYGLLLLGPAFDAIARR